MSHCVLIGNTGRRRCDFERYRSNRRCEPQLDRFGIMVSRCKKANVVACTDIGITRRWIFRLNLPLTAMSTVAVFYFMPLKPVEGSWLVKIKMVDFFGCALTLAASTLIVVSLSLRSCLGSVNDKPADCASYLSPGRTPTIPGTLPQS